MVVALSRGLALAAAALTSLPTWAQLGMEWTLQQRTHNAAQVGPLVTAASLDPAWAQADAHVTLVQGRGRARHTLGPWQLEAAATVQAHTDANATARTHGWIDEAFAHTGALGWQWTLGKKVVSWDVGYALRPNDLVQQEQRRTLTTAGLEGRVLAMAEHFDADSAWTLVWASAHNATDTMPAQESALAARYYQRAGAVDGYAFARQGAESGTSLGAAAVWVASDALAVHASVRATQYEPLLASGATGSTLVRRNPWQHTDNEAAKLALVGVNWTSEHQLGLILETWWDDTAPDCGLWRTWQARNQALVAAARQGADAKAVAGNLAWQASALGAAAQLHRRNVFARLSWQQDRHAWALDALLHPADGGRIVTASWVWSGESVRVEGVLRLNDGPPDALVRQLPSTRQAYLKLVWPL